MTVLSGDTIRDLCQFKRGGPRANAVITPFAEKQINPGSYDMRLGENYIPGFVDDNTRAEVLQLGRDQRLKLAANQVVLVEMEEHLNLPRNVVGHLTLKLDVLRSGVIIASQSQIDAGYTGRIYALLYNLSLGDVYLDRLQPILRLELAYLDKEVEPYDGDMKNREFGTDLLKYPAGFGSGLVKLKSQFDEYGKRTRRDTVIAAISATLVVLLGLGAIMGAIVVPFSDKASSAREEVSNQKGAIATLTQENRDLQERIRRLEIATASRKP